jgi:hypothetical protein
MWNCLKKSLLRLGKREVGSSIVELAIVFPILLLLFIGVAELGRLFYTYTTLAKATKVGARYLSSSRKVTKGTSTEIANEKTAARNLVICGFTNCTGKTPIVSGLDATNVIICDSFSVPCAQPIAGGTVKYFKVEITNYPFTPGVFNLDSITEQSSASFYFDLEPATEMRYMPN